MAEYHVFGVRDCPICKELFELFIKAVKSGRLSGDVTYRSLDDVDNLSEFAFVGNLDPPAVVVYDDHEMVFAQGGITSLSAISMSDFEVTDEEETPKSISVQPEEG